MTNYEKIKQMSIEEMAAAIVVYNNGDLSCLNCIFKNCYCSAYCNALDWLESEVEENEQSKSKKC